MVSDPQPKQTLLFQYQLAFDDGKQLEFAIEIDGSNETFVSHCQSPPPFWSELTYQQCENCSLSVQQFPHCPVAFNLIPLIDLCASLLSYENVTVTVTSAERSIRGNTSLQRVLSSMLGLIMATSPCPHTEFLKPMAHFHLPLASTDETLYRTTSMFLLAQYFRHKQGLPASLELDGLHARYDQLQVVNRALAKRLRAAISEDATVNAIILLNLLSQAVNWSIEDGLDELSYLFKPYGIQ